MRQTAFKPPRPSKKASTSARSNDKRKADDQTHEDVQEVRIGKRRSDIAADIDRFLSPSQHDDQDVVEPAFSTNPVEDANATVSYDNEVDEGAGPANVAPVLLDDPSLTIPSALVNRLVHHFLGERRKLRLSTIGAEDTTEAVSEVRIAKAAMPLIHKYIETLIREAIARAALEHQLELDGKRERGEAAGIGDDFLDVEDLEKLAPQLLLDF